MEILSVVGIVISVSGVLISLLLFCASVNNGRKILLNRIIYTITYEILWLFSAHPYYGNVTQVLEKKEKFNKTMFALHKALHEISYSSEIGVPYLDFCKQEKTEDNKWRCTYDLGKTFHALEEYFTKRNIVGLMLMLEHYDSRLLLTNYYQKRKYIRKMYIGPIIGVKLQYVRMQKQVCYVGGGTKTDLIKKIKNIKDYKKYYKKCYLRFDFGNSKHERKAFERTFSDFVIETEEQLPITLYR